MIGHEIEAIQCGQPRPSHFNTTTLEHIHGPIEGPHICGTSAQVPLEAEERRARRGGQGKCREAAAYITVPCGIFGITLIP